MDHLTLQPVGASNHVWCMLQFRGQHNPFAVHTEAQNRPQGISRMLSISSRWAGYGGGPGTGGSSSAANLSPAGAAAMHARSSSPLAPRNSIGSQVHQSWLLPLSPALYQIAVVACTPAGLPSQMACISNSDAARLGPMHLLPGPAASLSPAAMHGQLSSALAPHNSIGSWVGQSYSPGQDQQLPLPSPFSVHPVTLAFRHRQSGTALLPPGQT